MFWKLKYHTPSAIDGLLDKEDCTLEQILDEDDVLQECKTQNRKLIDFLVEPDKISALINFVTNDPSHEVEEKVRFKYPHVACEILTAEVFSITEKLCDNKKLINKLWEFLEVSEQLNPLIGSFTSKVIIMLLCQKASVVYEYVLNYTGFIDKLLHHLNTSAMMDLLLQMVAAPDTDQMRLDLAKWLNDQNVVQKLIGYIHHTADPEQCYNASLALCDMLRLSRESAQMSSPAPLLETLESAEVVELLLKNMFDVDDVADNVVLSGISYLLMLVDTRRAVNMFYGGFGSMSYSTSEEPSNIQLEATCRRTLRVLQPRMKDLHSILLRNPKMLPQRSSVGDLNPPLGNTRLQTIHLVTAIVEANDTKINQELVQLNTLSILLDLFFRYPWNNFLHAQVEECFIAAFDSSTNATTSISETLEQDSPFDPHQSNAEDSAAAAGAAAETNTKSSFLIEHIFSQCHLIQRLLDGYAKNEEICKNGGRRQGYMGHLMRIINAVYRHCHDTADVLEILQDSVDEAICNRWSDFLKGPLIEHNKRNETNLGGSRPLASSVEESDEEGEIGYGQDNDAEKAYSLYQNVKFVNNFIDDFGHPDELNTMEEPISTPFDRLDETSFDTPANFESTPHTGMFETVCLERIQQFDDPIIPDEEDVEMTWTEKEFTYDVSYSTTQSAVVGASDMTSSDDDDEVIGPVTIREVPTAGSSTDTDEDDDEEDDETTTSSHPQTQTNYYTHMADDSATALFISNEQDATKSSPWPSVNTTEVAPVPHGTIPDWTMEPGEAAEQVGWAHFDNAAQQSVTETRQSIVQEGEVPTSHLPEVAQSPDSAEDPASQGYSQLPSEEDIPPDDTSAEKTSNETTDPSASQEEKYSEEIVITFDDDHKAPDQLTKDVTTNTTEESSQVQANTSSSDNTELQTHLVNHQPKDSENSSESKTDEQSAGGEPPSSSSGSSDSKTQSEDDAPVLGLRFSNIATNQHSVNNTSENTNEDEGDLLGDNLDELLSTSRGSKYRVDENNDDEANKEEQEDLENNFNFLSSGMLSGNKKAAGEVAAASNSNSTSDDNSVESARAQAKEAFQQWQTETQHGDGDNDSSSTHQ